MSSVLVLLSGGQDSATCLAMAESKYDEIHTISFDYGQRHLVELECSKWLSEAVGAKSHTELKVSSIRQLGGSALIEDGNISGDHVVNKDLPASFVPGRNYLFLGLAAAKSYQLGVKDMITGVCQTDFCVSGDTLIDCPRNLELYPDGIPIRELVDKEFMVWSWDIEKQQTVLKPAFNVRKTLENTPIFEVKYEWGVGRNKSIRTIKATENHRFLLRSGEYVKLKDLKLGDSLQPFHTAFDSNYRLVTDRPGHVYYEHKMIVVQQENVKMESTFDWVAHHKDKNPLNNNCDNLVAMDHSNHMAMHAKEKWASGMMDENNLFINDNPMGHKVFRKKVSKKKKEWWDNITPEKREEFKDRARENTLKQMKELEYINPSQLPGVKFKQRYMAYKRYGNEDGMESVRIEAERNGFSLNHKVVSIKAVGNEDAFDIEVKDTHNFAANGIFIHNSGYPDCRDTSIKAVQAALNLCLDYDIIIHTPLMWMTKAGTVLKMDSLGKLDWYKNTVTCYEGKRPPCGKCPSCLLRAKGFEEAGFKDPAVEAFNG